MKRNRIALGAAVLAAILLGGALLFLCSQPTVLGHTEGLTEEEILEQLMELGPWAFKREMALFFADPDLEQGMCWLQAMFNRADEYSDQEILRKFFDFIPIDEDFATIWLGMYRIKHPDGTSDDPRLWAFLRDPDASPGWKGAVLDLMRFETQQDLMLLRQFAWQKDRNLRLSATRRLEALFPSISLEEAWQTVGSGPAGPEQQLENAVIAISRYLTSDRVVRGDYWRQQAEKWIDFCRLILQNDPSLALKNTVLYELQTIQSLDALKMVVSHPDVSQIDKQVMIANNYCPLEQALLAPDPSAEDIRFAVDCMEILPIKNLHDPLKAVLSPAEAEELAPLLETMEKKGVTAKTWLKDGQ